MLIMSYTLGKGGQRRIRTYPEFRTLRGFLLSALLERLQIELKSGEPSSSLTLENESWEEWYLEEMLSADRYFPAPAYAFSSTYGRAICLREGVKKKERWYAPTEAPKSVEWLWNRLSRDWYDVRIREHVEVHVA